MSSNESPTQTRHAHSPSAGDADHRGFAPGIVLAGRYRIVSLIGEGGMGEVYRADDLKLAQPVALKFLPERLALDASRLARFLNEVRVARQVSHPSVCRVHDVGEVDGHHFLSMEYVDGEDLASLLRRIGRLPKDKGVQIAWQICAGLAAAHERGVLHRDLKPANIMIDGRGMARLTDFGLAVIAGDAGIQGEVSGTPVYMSPEQFQGRDVAVASDLYSLGVVLYELFTGKPPFRAASVSDLSQMHREAAPPRPSSLPGDVDPALERLILQCLEKDPQARPPSARAVMAALPGGDPLQAALAAGETPSPAMVAAAGAAGDLRPPVAWACLAAVVVGLVAVGVLSDRTRLYRLVPFGKPPDVLVERARQIVRMAGILDAPADWDAGFGSTNRYLRYLVEHDPSPFRLRRLAAADREAVYFLYRQSPAAMEPQNRSVQVWWDDPPLAAPGMVTVVLGTEGRLAHFYAVPPEFQDVPQSAPAPEWPPLLAEAGFDPAALMPSVPQLTPPVASDARVAWQVRTPRPLDGPIRVEAASDHGRPVSFRVMWAWDVPAGAPAAGESLFSRLLRFGVIGLGNAVALLGAVILARRNLKLGRGDRTGAFRIALAFFSASLLAGVLGMHQSRAAGAAWAGLERLLAVGLFDAARVWFFYVALEPYVRRRWPQILMAWSRLVAGRFRDSLVGREILVGALCGTAMGLIWHLGHLAPRPFEIIPSSVDMSAFAGARQFLGALVGGFPWALFMGLINLFVLILYRILFRNDRLAILALVVNDVAFNLWMYPGQDLPGELAFLTAIWATAAVALVRFGLLALVAACFFMQGLHQLPTSLDLTAWYAGYSLVNLLALVSVAAYAFRTSLGAKPVFGARLLED